MEYDKLSCTAPEEVTLAQTALLRGDCPNDRDYFAHEILVRLLKHGDPESLDLDPQQAGNLALPRAKLLVEAHGRTSI